ncbi:MAG: prepilin-type N-terminal cleavage/methylation domain-containing protein [Candidatus Omnitrophica bacterium]|nr:prepilin-type N-terminal cleavage/methylation domain-containing protein [Candidatus Omnitrophota bacterium]
MRKNNIMFRRPYLGFTLTELLIVVIIIGILIALALPMLVKTMEKAKLKEVLSSLNFIRTGEKAYFLEHNQYTLNISDLNIDDPNTLNSNNRYFSYDITSVTASPHNFTARAMRIDGPYSGKSCYIDKYGTITSDGDYFTP